MHRLSRNFSLLLLLFDLFMRDISILLLYLSLKVASVIILHSLIYFHSQNSIVLISSRFLII
jgi:hypothetical protein